MILDAVIPVLNGVEYTAGMLYSIAKCAVQPRRLYLIDNGSEDTTRQTCENFKAEIPGLEYVRFETNIGVNAAWNYAFKNSDADHIWVLNNDMVLNNRFFERTIQFFETYPNCDMGQAFDIADIEKVNQAPDAVVGSDAENVMIGYAFTVSKRLLAISGLIPESMFIYCGDQWLFDIAKEENMQILLMKHNYLYHYISRTCKRYDTHNTRFPTDLAEWRKLTKERCKAKGVPLPWNIIPW